MRVAWFIAVLATLAGCEPSSEPATPVANERSAQSASEVKAPATEASATDRPAQETRRIALSSNGLVVMVADRPPTSLDFGQDGDRVIAAIEENLGRPRLSRLDECGAGPMEFAAYGSLTLNFLGGKFVGWRAEQGAQVVTVDGSQLGNTLADIQRERSARRIPATTLDGEFEYAAADGGTIGGFLDGPGDAAKVVALHAGTNCFFR